MKKNKQLISVLNKLKKITIIIFFTLNLAIMFIDGFPDRSALGNAFINFIARYQAISMLYQPWAMFAPNPMNTNAFIEADLEFTDGTIDRWKMPRPLVLTGIRKLLVSDRYRLLGQETLLANQNEEAWFDVAKYITRTTFEREKRSQGRTLKQITFSRIYSRITPPPEGNFIPHGQLSKSYTSESVFFYTPTYKEVRHEAKNSL